VIEPVATRLRDGRQWLDIADEDLDTARAQIYRMCEGQPVNPEDLDAPFAPVLAAVPCGRSTVGAVSATDLLDPAE
jgi:hypothetical protein